MSGYAAFLTARLDEDQAAADVAKRALREVEAGRKLLDLYERAKGYRDQVFARPGPYAQTRRYSC